MHALLHAQDEKRYYRYCRVVAVFVVLLSISHISGLSHEYLLFLLVVNERHRVPQPASSLSKLWQRKDHVIGVVRDDDVQRIVFGGTTPPAVIRFVGGTPV